MKISFTIKILLFTFFTLNEALLASAPYFREVRRFEPSYEMGERFQTILFEAV